MLVTNNQTLKEKTENLITKIKSRFLKREVWRMTKLVQYPSGAYVLNEMQTEPGFRNLPFRH